MAYNKTNWENLPSTSTPVNATNLNKIENGIKDSLIPEKQNLTNIKIRRLGNIIIVNILGSFSFTVASGTAKVIGTIPEGYRPPTLVGTPVIGKTTGFTYLPNCYIQIRDNGNIEFYQNSGSSQDIVQIIGSITFTID